jgi:glycosyltransferase involved in cell wall biosynthesis
MASSSLVTIVLPVHNGERYLGSSMQSCLEQTYRNLELIIVDDASTDATPDIIKSYAALDSRVVTVRHDINKGLPTALNTGFSLASGQYLTWTSHDNLYRVTAIAEMVHVLETEHNLGMVHANYSDINDEGELLGQSVWVGYSPDTLVWTNIMGPCFLYRREVYETIGEYDPSLILAEDYDYWFRVSQHFSIGFLDKDLYLYRRHDDSLTSQKQMRIAVMTEKVIVRNIEVVPRLPLKSRLLAYRRLEVLAHQQKATLRRAKYRLMAAVIARLQWLSTRGVRRRITAALGQIKHT